MSDAVNSPRHYNSSEIECIQAIEAMLGRERFQGYCEGNVLKYLWRHRYKGNECQDLEKARWYLNRLISSYTIFEDSTESESYKKHIKELLQNE